MFTTFSGKTRKPRQVNLSGRKPHAFGAGNPGSAPGPGPAALNRAQEDRVQRQRERDTLRAAQTLQRLWRGHASRKALSEGLRVQWDADETVSDADETVSDADDMHGSRVSPPESYASEEQSLQQLRRLLHFASVRDRDDLRRVWHWGSRQAQTAARLAAMVAAEWPSLYRRLQRLLLAVLDRQEIVSVHGEETWRSCIDLLKFVTAQAPEAAAQDATILYRALATVVSRLSSDVDVGTSEDPERDFYMLHATLDIAVAPLKTVTVHTLSAYEAFGYIFMTLPALSTDSSPPLTKPYRDLLAESINYKLLANALATLLRDSSGLYTLPELAGIPNRLRLLGTFIYFHRFAHNFHSPEVYSAHRDFVAVVSMLLNSLPANFIEAEQLEAEEAEDLADGNEVNEFLKEQILSLINQEGIGSLLSSSAQEPDIFDDQKAEEARQLASYALALLQFFPSRKEDIRLWLYLGPVNTEGRPNRHQAIRYFWSAARSSSVFEMIFRDSRAAIKLLKPIPSSTIATNDGTHNVAWLAPRQLADEITDMADEWRLILVFLELYTFVLKVTDDEEFFSALKKPSNNLRENALSLDEVKRLTTFLKNLGFTLYFNAADIVEPEEQETRRVGINFFSPETSVPEVQRKALEPALGGVAGLGPDYVKGLVTGLLRMVYERDSRRKFLPGDHWLMTSRFDMTAFIPAVVQEEESRHQIEEEDAGDAEEEEDWDETPQLTGTSRTQRQLRLERLQRQQRKASRRRYLQAVAPRLEILQNMPFFIPFTTRVQIFREFVHLDMTKRRGTADPESWRAMLMHGFGPSGQLEKHAARVRRENEFEDAFQQFYSLGQGLKEPIQITFVDQFDTPEAGIDGGGVTKEFLTSVISRAFMPTDYIDMFVGNDQHLLYPNPAALEEHKETLKQSGVQEGSAEFRMHLLGVLRRYEFLGRIIGKCLYEGILVDVNFAPFFLRKWALTGGIGSAPKETGYRPTLNDLRDLDEALYQGLHQLKTYTGDVEDFALNFTVTDNIIVDHTTKPKKTKAVTKDLQANGSNVAVTNQNRLFYISYIARHRLQIQPYQQTAAFLKGLGSMIQPSWLSMFNQAELQTLISGTSSSIDIDDLRHSTAYGGTYVIGDDGLEHPTVKLFWQVMTDLSDGERRAVLKFVTSTPRAPLLGFKTLNPRFSIRDAGSEQDRLPSTSTCVNLLKLPMYRDYALLKEKLLYSVFSGAGFDLS